MDEAETRTGPTLAAQRAAAARVRLCALTRQEKPVDEMLRFVLGPDGSMAPDLGGRLGGRGVWLTATRAAVEQASQRGVFAKSLKTQVKASPGLADLVDRQLLERARQSLSFAAKAGLVTTGYVKVDAVLEAGQAVLLVQAHDAADAGVERLQRKFVGQRTTAGQPAPILRHFGISELSMAFGRSNVVHAALADGGQTHAVLRDCLRLERFRKNDEAIGVSPPDNRSVG